MDVSSQTQNKNLDLIKISILVICKNFNELKNSSELLRLHSKKVNIEVLIAEGNNPSLQRNELVNQASGDYVLFMDGDSIPEENILEHYYASILAFNSALIFGGPSIVTLNIGKISELSNLFFTTFFGMGPFRKRYLSVGELRYTDESELILCNLLVEKKLFLKGGGFCKEIYPNEENEFLKRIKRNYPDVQMVFQPKAKVYREPRETLGEFSFQLYSYGQGRSKHINVFLEPRDIFFFMPTTLLLYFMVLGTYPSLLGLFPSFLYICLCYTNYFNAKEKRLSPGILAVPFFFLLGHLSYGAGFGVGLIKYKFVKKVLYYKERKISNLEIRVLRKFANI